MASKNDKRPRVPNLQRLEGAAELYLRDCYEKRSPARVAEFARFLGRARPYLSRLVVELTGVPLRDFLRTRQLARARQLLCTTPLPIDEIARASAFGSEWTFQRHFKAAFGLSPGEYRLRNESRAYALTVTPR